jgi:hypothetical protein
LKLLKCNTTAVYGSNGIGNVIDELLHMWEF